MAWKSAKLATACIACCGSMLLASAPVAALAVDEAPLSSTASSPDATGPTGAANAPQPQTRPQTAPAVPPGIRNPGWPFNQPAKASLSPTVPTAEEWEQTSKFMAETSPARWQMFENVLGRPARAERAKRFLFARYTELRELQKFSPAAYEARVQQIKFEDDLFRLESGLRAATSPGERDALTAQIRDRVRDAVKKDLGDRERRLAQLQERLDREKATLEADKARSDETTDRRAEVIRQSSERFRAWANGGNPNRPNNRPAKSPTAADPQDKPGSGD